MDERSIRCSCGCSNLVIAINESIEDDNNPFVSISFEDSYLGYHSDYGRLKRLSRIFKNEKEAYAEVVLKKDDALKFLRDSIDLIERS